MASRSTLIRRHPLAAGLLWAAVTVAVICVIQFGLGEPLPNPFIIVPIFPVAGALWCFWMKRHFVRLESAG